MSKHQHIARATLGAVAVAAAVAACGGSSHHKTSSSKAASASTPATTTTTTSSSNGSGAAKHPKGAKSGSAKVSTATTPTTVLTKNHKKARVVGTPVSIPVNVPQNLKARPDVTMSSCSAAPGGHAAGGTIKNTLGKSASYKITVIFTDARATALGYGTTTVSVASGKTAQWRLSGKFKAPAKVVCVLRGVNT